MKNLTFLAVMLLCVSAVWAQNHAFEWSLSWSGSWEKTSSIELNRTIHNQGEMTFFILPIDLLFRGQILDRRTLDFEDADPFGNPVREVTNFTGGLFHTATNSRALYGVLEESGLPARIRNPWIRSPPYTENHRATIATLRSEATSTREDEAYIYLSSPQLQLAPNFNLRPFVSAQMGITNDAYAFCGGLDINFDRNTNLLLETFYTAKTLAPTTVSTWFSYPPPLPEREFHLYAAGLLFKSQYFALSSDFALSETFAWGTDIYTNLGMSIFLRPWFIFFAADGAGSRYVNRDGSNYSEGFRGAARVERRGRYNSLFRAETVLRAPSFGEQINRGTVTLFYRSPVNRKNVDSFEVARVSLSASRNAENPIKITDSFKTSVGVNIGLNQGQVPLRINVSGSLDTVTEYEVMGWNSASISGEVICQFGRFRVRTKVGSTFFAEKEEILNFSVNTSVQFSPGRLSFWVESTDFPDK